MYLCFTPRENWDTSSWKWTNKFGTDTLLKLISIYEVAGCSVACERKWRQKGIGRNRAQLFVIDKPWLHVSCDSRGNEFFVFVCVFLCVYGSSCSTSLPLQSPTMTTLTLTSLQCCWITALASEVNFSTLTICIWVTELIQPTQHCCSALTTGSHRLKMLLRRLRISVQHQPTLVKKSCQIHPWITLQHIGGVVLSVVSCCTLSGTMSWNRFSIIVSLGLSHH